MIPFKQFGGEVPIPNNKASSLFRFIHQHLATQYSSDEVNAIANLLMEHFAGITSIEFRKNPDQLLNQSVIMQVHGALDLLKQGKPVQQIIGWCEFYYQRYIVNEHVLIPRPETEELVELTIQSSKIETPTILDIGTGSGCIAISLKKAFPKAEVWAMDVSVEAMNIARKNAQQLEADIMFFNADLFSFNQWNNLPEFDIIISNPPYIAYDEINSIPPGVKDFEPHIALFVAEKDPLVFYRKIAEIGRLKLKPQGQIWVEINERLGIDTYQVFVDAGYPKVVLLNDLSGKHRFVNAQLE
ncbi:MAG: peptide chain release factor N(5)-glutamine methyltransferase [Flavobacteriales bacterium]|nr:peptide chain release factor N(5)-glutamine methyltransferase [Flavobacteriales bacterium]